jgi:hypothetical protein
MKRESEHVTFENTVRQLLKVSHSEIKAGCPRFDFLPGSWGFPFRASTSFENSTH